MVLTILAILGLVRVRIAFALLAAPFFGLAAYKLINGSFFSPDWSLFRSPLAVVRWAFEIVLLLGIAGYFWGKFSGQDSHDP